MASTRASSYAATKNTVTSRAKSIANLHQDVIAHHISVKDLIDSGILLSGDQVWFKDQTAVLQPSGNISFKGVEFTSLSKWAKHVASALGLTKHYNGWKVAIHKSTQRPMGQFRDKFYAEHAGLPYTFPPMESKKRKKPTPRVGVESTRKPRTAGLVALSRVSNLPRSRSLSEDSESNTSSNNGEDQEMEEWASQPLRVSQRKRNLRTVQDFYVEMDENGMVTESEEEDWYDSPRSDSMIGEVDSTPCGEAGCYVCESLNPSFATHFPTWADILQLALYSLAHIRNNDKLFFSLGEEIYPFIDRHWYKLCSKPRNSSWRQTAKMTLAHSRYADLFENGYDQLLKTGYWRLKNANRDSIEQLSAGVASSSRGTPHVNANAATPSSPRAGDGLKFSVPVTPFNGVRASHSISGGDEHMSLLASLAVAEGSDDLNALSSLSSLVSKRHDIMTKSDPNGLDDVDDYSTQHAADRRRAMAQQYRTLASSTPATHDPIQQVRKEYQILEAKYKALEQEHRSALMQLETVQSILLASRRQDETTRLSYAQQAELQEGQVRLLLDKVQRLEYELYQRTANSGTPNSTTNSSANSLPLMNGAVGSQAAALSAMMGVSGLPKIGLLNQGSASTAFPSALYGNWPLGAGAGSLPPLGWPLDLNNNAAKLQLAQFQVHAQQAQAETPAPKSTDVTPDTTSAKPSAAASTSPTAARPPSPPNSPPNSAPISTSPASAPATSSPQPAPMAA